MEAQQFKERLGALPHKPGVYLFRDDSGNVIYVGKASDLRNRVRSYFGPAVSLPPKIRRMSFRISDLEFFVTDSEQEALIMECDLIKKHRPRYNIRLKDDKTYPYLKIDAGDDWARVYVTRRVEPDGSRYFGPYASARSVKSTLKVLQKIFQFRTCNRRITGNDSRACVEYDIHRCVGPCIGAVTRDEYRSIIEQVIMFLSGRYGSIVKTLQKRMREASEGLEFERAAVLRDQVSAILQVVERQKIVSTRRRDMDIVALAQDRDQAYVEIFFVRGGRLIDRDHLVMNGARDETPGRIVASFMNQFYRSSANVPPLVVLQYMPDEAYVIESWLTARRGSGVEIRVPQRGELKRLVDMAAVNARQGLEQLKVKQAVDRGKASSALNDLTGKLQLPGLPERIECYDISDIQGAYAVGSMVVFLGGTPRRSEYRRFRIKAVHDANDYAMMREVLRRRFKRTDSAGGSWATVPNLVLIDGGRGHLNTAVEALKELGLDHVAVAAIAKGEEAVFRPDISEPIVLGQDSAALQLLQRVRDEAHRFAITYHRNIRSRGTISSALDNVPGIGGKRKRALLKAFGSVRGIREADIDEVAAVPGMTRSLAEKVKAFL